MIQYRTIIYLCKERLLRRTVSLENTCAEKRNVGDSSCHSEIISA